MSKIAVSKIEELISDIEDYIDSCKSQPFSNNKKIIVDKDQIDDLLVDLRLRVPDEIKKYQKIIVSRDSILADAKEKAANMLDEASRQTAALTNEHEIRRKAMEQANDLIEQANKQAQEIVDQATRDANYIREGAIHYTDEMLKTLQTIISHAMENTQGKFSAFLTSMQGSYDIVMANRKELCPQEEMPEGSATEYREETAEDTQED